MPKNLVICCDGTNNQFGAENTNVVRVIQALVRDPSRQRLYYDPGVGTLPEPAAWTAIGKKVSTYIGLAFGAGIFWKVQEAYEFLPKLQYRSTLGRSAPAIGRGRHRRIVDGAFIHACALHRLRKDPTYRPPNLSRAFVDAVCALPAVPASLPYAPDGMPRATPHPETAEGSRV